MRYRKPVRDKEKELDDVITRSRGWLRLEPIKNKNGKRNPKIRIIKAR